MMYGSNLVRKSPVVDPSFPLRLVARLSYGTTSTKLASETVTYEENESHTLSLDESHA
ncbi:hypothetical protein BDV06DRAFT_203324 [Aspergillus oleicola]